MPLRPNYHLEKEAREPSSPAMPEKGNKMPGTYVNHNEPADPLDVAMQPPEPAQFWGCVKDIEMFKIGFKKLADGSWERPTPYDPNYHDFSANQIRFTLLPLDPTRPIKELEMGLNTRKNPEFRKIVQPSIFALEDKIKQIRGENVTNLFRALIGLYIHGEYVPRPWNKADEDWTTLEFRDVFATEEECQAHQAATRGEDDSIPFPSASQPQQAQASDPMRQSMAAFLPGLWAQAGQNKMPFLKLIADNPMVAQHFNADSPEVQAILAQAAPEKIPF